MAESESQNGKGWVKTRPTGTLSPSERPMNQSSNNIDVSTIKKTNVRGRNP